MNYQNVTYDGSRFLLLVGSLFLLDFVFSISDCGDCHIGIRIAVLDYFQFETIETKSYLCYLSCFCLCEVYVSADDMVLSCYCTY